jgi:hypothetical protein
LPECFGVSRLNGMPAMDPWLGHSLGLRIRNLSEPDRELSVLGNMLVEKRTRGRGLSGEEPA